MPKEEIYIESILELKKAEFRNPNSGILRSKSNDLSFETRSHFVTQFGLKFVALLPPFPKY